MSSQTMPAPEAAPPVLTERLGRIGLITLNRPAALNALNLAMIRLIDPALRAWAEDPAVGAVVIRGAGGRAFCAGGDVRAVYEAGMQRRRGEGPGDLTRDFFAAEYRLNWAIHTYPKPYVALIDGIAMGGGLGLSVHGAHRVVTARAALAMPETGIGLFPDIGAGWFLPRCPGEIGTWLALTGAQIGAADALHCGLATHFVPGERLDALVDSLAAGQGVGEALAAAAADPGVAPLAARQAAIDRCFGAPSVEAILAALDAEPDDWAASVAAGLRTRSPTSLKVALRQLRLTRALSYRDIVALEYRLSQACMEGHDFYEGIRALLVDKDRRPKWSPADLRAVDEALVERHFAPPAASDLVIG